MDAAPILDREFLEKLERLALRWQKSFPGLVGGHNPSRCAGAGQEFLDHRTFHHGDDLRAVNWRAYLRLEKLFLKMFQVEPRVPVRMLVDTSDSMKTGGKFDYARRMAGALCYVGMVRLDAIELHPFSNKLGHRYLCAGGRHRFGPVLDALGAMETGGRTDFFAVLREFITRYAQRGLTIVISDFLDDQGCERALQFLADFGHELMLLQIWSEEDRTPPWDGDLELEDAETGGRLKVQFDPSARARYTESFDQFSTTLQKLAWRNNGRYAGICTAQPVEEIVFGPLLQERGVA
ncbi:MAG TPA: DUF58 domain-containing protein [Bryobacteraceae bacterium]|nr:DUF58 domain-containing protein [Bryobacteraceae bacterium]